METLQQTLQFADVSYVCYAISLVAASIAAVLVVFELLLKVLPEDREVSYHVPEICKHELAINIQLTINDQRKSIEKSILEFLKEVEAEEEKLSEKKEFVSDFTEQDFEETFAKS